MKSFRIFIIVVVTIIIAIIVYNKIYRAPRINKKSQAEMQKELPVVGYIVKSEKISSRIEASGTLLSAEQVNLQSEISEKVMKINFKEGSYVIRGAILVKLNDNELQAQLKKLIIQKQMAEATEQRLKQLLSMNGVGQQDYDNALLQLNNIKADIDIVQTQIEKTEIRAPFSGKIGLRNVSVGAYILPSTVISSIQQTDSLKVDFFIPEKYSQVVSEGDEVRFRVDASNNEFTGKVYAIESKIDEASRSIQVRAIFNNTKAKLQPGTFARVFLDLKDIPETIMIPSQSIIPEAKGKKVVVCKNKKALFKNVITGIRNESEVQILEGLEVGDTIVTTGILYLKPDMKLKIKKTLN
ncbi:MAG: efflux RND transporter periplasmic adaptor subunit [Bacteroidales bacterium]|nr:efflux RND transporter periplasmic adaptor subunit [Bacteroidales bacterium]